MKIKIITKPIKNIRNQQADDYFYDKDGTLVFHIAEMNDVFLERMMLIHGLIEWTLAEEMGVSEPAITAFDVKFMAEHPDDDEEAGDDPKAPYNLEHSIATATERIMCAYLGKPWKEYQGNLKKALS